MKHPVHSLLAPKREQKSVPCYFCRAPCTELIISRESAMLKHSIRNIKKSYHWDFPKVVVSKYSMRGETHRPFHRAHCT